MEEPVMDRKALGQAKLEARRLRVARIRRKVAVFSASLALVFSRLVVGLQGIPLLVGGREDSGGTEVVQADGIEQQIGATVTAFASGLILGDDDDEEEEGGGFLGLGTSRSSSSPAPTTSQS